MIKRLFYILICGAIIIACSSSDDNNTNGGDGFDRPALLNHVANNIIIPSLQDFNSKLLSLNTVKDAFANDMTQANLDALNNAWLEAYKVYQHVEMYNIGYLETLTNLTPEQDKNRGFVRYFNIYPISASTIDGYAATGSYDLTDALTNQGFPALDYLINATVAGDSTPLEKFTTNPNASGYMVYTNDVINRMQTIISEAINHWQNTYLPIFIAATENGLSGSVNKIANDFVFVYEKGFRAQKVGTPAGIFSAGQIFPDKVEAYYKKDVSRVLALESLTAIENFFEGKTYNSNAVGSSLKSYIEFLDGTDVTAAISNQFTAVREALGGLDENFSDEITNNNIQVLATYNIMQAMVPLLKADMRQILNFSFDYEDSDGD